MISPIWENTLVSYCSSMDSRRFLKKMLVFLVFLLNSSSNLAVLNYFFSLQETYNLFSSSKETYCNYSNAFKALEYSSKQTKAKGLLVLESILLIMLETLPNLLAVLCRRALICSSGRTGRFLR